MPTKFPWRRRTQYLIARYFQFRFSILLIGVGGVVTLMVGFILYGVLVKTQQLLIGTGLVVSPQVIDFLREQRGLYLYSLAAVFLAITALLMGVGILISHRLAGPIFAMIRKMEALSRGDFNAELSLRKSDEFHDLKDQFNTLVRALKNQVKSELIKIDALVKSVEMFLEQRQLSEEPEHELRAMLRDLQSYYIYKKNLLEPASAARFKPAEATDEEILM